MAESIIEVGASFYDMRNILPKESADSHVRQMGDMATAEVEVVVA